LADAPPSSSKLNATSGEPRGVHLFRDGDGTIGDDDGGDDPDGDNMSSCIVTLSLTPESASVSAVKKKKRKKPKKKSSRKQSSPPRIPVCELFPDGRYPHGEVQSYEPAVENTARVTADEVRYHSRRHLADDTFLNDYRKAAEIHRQVRRWTQDTVRPGQTLTDIAVGIEDGVRALLDNSGLETGDGLVSGLGFPTGLSLNNCVAHYTPNPGQKDVVLRPTDVMKIDFGVHINGWIVDSAFTMSFDPTYDHLIAAVKDATNTGIKVPEESVDWLTTADLS
jgi:methionyl aminopeptidase